MLEIKLNSFLYLRGFSERMTYSITEPAIEQYLIEELLRRSNIFW